MPLRDYDVFAGRYAENSEDNIYNGAYERPAIRALLPDVRGLRVLDAGCAAGTHSAWLAEHGADVDGIDVSEPMIALARTRLGARARFHTADLEQRLPFDDGTFDLVMSSLALHYVRELEPAIAEFARVLRPGGTLVFSTHSPLMEGAAGDYGSTRLVEDAFTGYGPEPVRVRWYHRPFSAIVTPLLRAGFALDEVAEPPPDETIRARDPRTYETLSRRPPFLFVRARLRSAPD
jgi:SAM-dependent methyltransferase